VTANQSRGGKRGGIGEGIKSKARMKYGVNAAINSRKSGSWRGKQAFA